MKRFAIDTEFADGVAYVRFEGELDISVAVEAEEHLREVERSETTRIVLDLSHLSFMDSTGLRIVLAADTRARNDGRTLGIVRGPASVHRVFELALLEDRLGFLNDGGA